MGINKPENVRPNRDEFEKVPYSILHFQVGDILEIKK